MVGPAARLTSFVAASALAANAAAAPLPTWAIDAGCRDGQPHGRYALRSGDGALQVAGAFNHGKRTGSFIFWTPSGSRIAHIPYEDDGRNGTLATWYAAATPGEEPPRRSESAWRHGIRDGVTRTWYEDGQRRSETDYARGTQVATAGWTDAGARLGDRAAREIAERDAAAADARYAELEALVRDHLPRCD